jgi:hypothetical protein
MQKRIYALSGLESAAFQTVKEAEMFCRDLSQQFSAPAKGEMEPLEEMITPEPQPMIQINSGDDNGSPL